MYDDAAADSPALKLSTQESNGAHVHYPHVRLVRGVELFFSCMYRVRVVRVLHLLFAGKAETDPSHPGSVCTDHFQQNAQTKRSEALSPGTTHQVQLSVGSREIEANLLSGFPESGGPLGRLGCIILRGKDVAMICGEQSLICIVVLYCGVSTSRTEVNGIVFNHLPGII